MSSKITLESKQRLPSKVQDVICDAALIIQHATSASGSSELLTTSAKQICATEPHVNGTAAALNKLDVLLDSMHEQSTELENRVPLVTDVLATLQTIERAKFFTEEGRPRPISDSDAE
ncbi:unnamed protein product [Nippostrongylus brasiliensis]|uniref:BLOC-1-related complex subunit 7 n=1 Tax=Nippostrongylus brasiliensis TaxID=27835 RepID=A0A0N4Y4U8_NIPBR|nr:unnamed protein product [Nippostrongylus brasiliensis]